MTWVSCPINGKRGFLTEADALRALRHTQGVARRCRQAGVPMVARQERRVYECDCGRWHLTSKELVVGGVR